MKNGTVLLTLIVCLVFVVIAFVSTFDDGTFIGGNIDPGSTSEIINGYNIDEIDSYSSVRWEQKEITGNVKVPGIYEVSDDVTYIKLIKYAGGLRYISPRVILEILTENNGIDDKDREIMIKSQ